MIGNIRMLAMGAGALGAAGAATFFGVTGPDRDRASIDGSPDFTICLKTDIRYFEGVEARCYQRSDLVRLRDAPLVDQGADQIVVNMTHPSEATVPASSSATCREYEDALWEGRYALSTSDMRREAYFIRACRALDMLLDAVPAEISHFEGGSPSEVEVAAIAAEGLLRFDPEGGPIVAAEVAKTGAADWRITGGGETAILQEIANADFDGDRIEEILVFLSGGPEDGAARAAAVALLEKDAAGDPVLLTVPAEKRPRGGASGAP